MEEHVHSLIMAHSMCENFHHSRYIYKLYCIIEILICIIFYRCVYYKHRFCLLKKLAFLWHNALIIMIIIIPRQCLWCCHHGRAIVRGYPVHLMNVEWRQATNPDDLACESACTGVYTHHRHLLLLFSPKADTHFTIPRRVEG